MSGFKASPAAAERWRQIEEVFGAASQMPESARQAFVEKACGSDPELRREVESLLASSAAIEAQESDPILSSTLQNVAEGYLRAQSTRIAAGVCLDHYRVIRLLGRGGMGEVYLAEDVQLKRKVALKMLPWHLTRNAAALQRLEAEARIVSALNQANLLTVYEFCQVESRHFLVTEFIEGETLRQMLNRGPLEAPAALDIAIQVATGLAAAHASGVIHRDIKPENIMVRGDGCVKLLDFGVATLSETQPDPAASEAPMGTPRYMSPEQARGAQLDARTDIFSLGAVLYEMLAGKPLNARKSSTGLDADAPSANLPKAPRELRLIVSKAIKANPRERYQTAQVLLADLQQFRRALERKRETGRHTALFWAASLILLICLAASLIFQFRARKQAEIPRLPRSLAVLPFRNLKPDSSTDFLGFSLADEVIARLGYVKTLIVRPSSAVGRYRNGAGDLRKAAEELNADMLLTGTYLKDGNDLRITARLIGFNPDSMLWQDSIDVKYDKLLTVQDRVASMVINGLSVRLQPDEQQRLSANRPVNSLAYEYYLRGVDLYSSANFGAAVEMLQKSSALDPNYAPAWAYLGRALTTNASLQFGGREDYRQAEAAYEKAISLNPVFPEPRVYMANLFTDTGRVEAAVPLVRVALRSSPNDAEAHWELGYAYRYGGMLKESAVECELARRLDPEVKINSSALNTYLYLFEYDKFLNSLPANDSPLMVFYHGLGSYYKHDYGTASSDFDRAFDLSPDLLPAQVGKALGEGLSHHEADGLARLHQTEERMQARGVRDPEAMYKIAQGYALLGDPASALRMLKLTAAGGFFCYSYISQDPLLHSLHGLPEFAPVLKAIHQRADQFAERFAK